MKVIVESKGKMVEHDVFITYRSDAKSHYITAFDKQKNKLGSLSFANVTKIPNTAWLYQIYVKEQFRGQGVGTALLTVFLAYCLENDKIQILGKFVPENERSEDFYRKNGFDFKAEFLNVLLVKKVDQSMREKVFGAISGYEFLGQMDKSNAQPCFKNDGQTNQNNNLSNDKSTKQTEYIKL